MPLLENAGQTQSLSPQVPPGQVSGYLWEATSVVTNVSQFARTYSILELKIPQPRKPLSPVQTGVAHYPVPLQGGSEEYDKGGS